MKRIDAVVLGATGYVGGELLRLIHAHPVYRLAAAVSGSRSGEAIAAIFPHLAAAYPSDVFANPYSWVREIDRGIRLALFSAAPHGASADMVCAALEAAAKRDLTVHLVDTSADFRFRSADAYESVYGLRHPQAKLLKKFICAVPEHEPDLPAGHVAHPGCFATAVLLATVPLVNTGVADEQLFVSGITGSTGSGRSPQEGTHHPERHSNLYAYKPLEHRHAPEIEGLLERATGRQAAVRFVPHSGPFARGIYVTVQARLAETLDGDRLRARFAAAYDGCEFVRVLEGIPRLKDVVSSNYAHIGVTVQRDTAVVTCAIDNLVKGAAGGAMQWMNRLWSLRETDGLLAAAPAWT
ncbi:MAG: N-acetyl-gamma-glutamyl-phosphate reductase [Woeseiaceae bacterium]